MTTFIRSQKLLVYAGIAALGGAALLTLSVGNIFAPAGAGATAVDVSLPFVRAEFPVCHTPATSGVPNLMLRLAQTEVPRAEMSAASSAVGFADTEPPLWDGLGSVTYKITTTNDRAQAYFDQGLRLAYAFNHGEAQRARSAWRKSSILTAPCASGARRSFWVPTS